MKIKILLAGLMSWIFSFAMASELPKVVASASIFEDILKHIGGEKIEAASIVPIGGDPHIYEPTPSDAMLVASADLILINGLTFEGWITELIDNSGTNAKVILITEGIIPIASERYKNAFDPHAWMDASNGVIYASNIASALQQMDPENKSFYQHNLEKYTAQLRDLDEYIFDAINTIPKEHRILITSHDAFAYYGNRYGIELSAIMGISTDAEAQTSDIIRVSKTIKESGIPAIFIESTINPKLLQQLAKDNKINIGGELFSDSIGDESTEANGYLEMLKHNTDIITKALSQNILSETKIDDDNTSSNWILYLSLGVLMVASLLFLIIKMK